MKDSTKHIKVQRPLPEHLKKAIEQKKDWIKKTQSGKMNTPPKKKKDRVL